MQLAEYLSIQPSYMDGQPSAAPRSSSMSSTPASRDHAGSAVALITHGEMGYSARRGRASR
jgi:hypothetical protein